MTPEHADAHTTMVDCLRLANAAIDNGDKSGPPVWERLDGLNEQQLRWLVMCLTGGFLGAIRDTAEMCGYQVEPFLDRYALDAYTT